MLKNTKNIQDNLRIKLNSIREFLDTENIYNRIHKTFNEVDYEYVLLEFIIYDIEFILRIYFKNDHITYNLYGFDYCNHYNDQINEIIDLDILLFEYIKSFKVGENIITKDKVIFNNMIHLRYILNYKDIYTYMFSSFYNYNLDVIVRNFNNNFIHYGISYEPSCNQYIINDSTGNKFNFCSSTEILRFIITKSQLIGNNY